jgi:RNA polymerase sigma-70 factor (ECF subfamily)
MRGAARPRWRRWTRWLAAALRAIHAGDPPSAASGGAAGGDRALAARQAEFEAFFRQHERDIFTYLWRLTSSETSAYDLTQETFLRAWQHFDKVAGYKRPGGWLFRVATNLALNHLRQSRTPLGAAAALDERDHVGDDPARGVVESDQVRRALMALAPRQRAALVLREVYGLTGDELAAALGISVGAAKTLAWRARDEFRTRYLGEPGNSGAFRDFRREGPR